MNIPFESWLRPRVFITYAREDGKLARAIRDSLTSAGFAVFFDVREILTGEHFARVIEDALRRCDSVVAIVSAHSVESDWCIAELLEAHALRKPIAPVLAGQENLTFPEPLKFFQEPLHYISATQPGDYSIAVHQLERDLSVARKRRNMRIITRTVAGVATIMAVVFGSLLLLRSMNDVTRERDRKDILTRVSSASTTLTRATVANLANRLPGDPIIIERLTPMTQNRELSDVQRINAIMLVNKLLTPQIREQRWYLKDIQWDNAELLKTSLSSVTFMSGNISHLTFSEVSFGGVSWNQSPLNGRSGLMLSNVSFKKCRFDGGWFQGTGAVGSRLDVHFLLLPNRSAN